MEFGFLEWNWKSILESLSYLVLVLDGIDVVVALISEVYCNLETKDFSRIGCILSTSYAIICRNFGFWKRSFTWVFSFWAG